MSTSSDIPPQPQAQAQGQAQPPPAQFQWKQCMELGYADGPDSNDDMADPVCFHCGREASLAPPSSSAPPPDDGSAPETTLSRCAGCHVVTYCSRECQVASWKKGPEKDDDGAGGGTAGGGGGSAAHKFACSAYQRVGTDMILTYPDDKQSARQDFFHRIRMYASPYFIHRSRQFPPSSSPEHSDDDDGFLFVQSDSTLAELSLPHPILSNGRPMTRPRAVLLHYLTVREYADELCRDDFELVAVGGELRGAVAESLGDGDGDGRREYAVLMRFRCGHVAVGTVPLVPDYGLCVMLGEQYYGGGEGSGPVQLNLDDI